MKTGINNIDKNTKKRKKFGVNGTFNVRGNQKALATFELTRGGICFA